MEENNRINAPEEPGEAQPAGEMQPDARMDARMDAPAADLPAEAQPRLADDAQIDLAPQPPQPRWVNRQFKALRQQQERLQRQMAGAQALQAAQAREWMRSDPEYLALRQKAQTYERAVFDSLFRQDAADIQRAFPEFEGRSVDELGEPFAALRANGVDAVTAYAALRAAEPPAPVMGAVGQTPAGQEFYSKEEYEALVAAHPELLEDPAFVDSIINQSMPKWRN